MGDRDRHRAEIHRGKHVLTSRPIGHQSGVVNEGIEVWVDAIPHVTEVESQHENRATPHLGSSLGYSLDSVGLGTHQKDCRSRRGTSGG